MRRFFYGLFFSTAFLLRGLPALAQVNFHTVVPQHAIVVGESFQVQYVLENAEKVSDISFPKFDGFRVVTGSNTYSGKKLDADGNLVRYKNVVFTLEAMSPGKFRIDGAECKVENRIIKSNNVIVQVVSSKETDGSLYYLRPGDDPYKKISENLFLKLTVDKRTCFVGEPLVACFKLYSRLQSKSNIIKNPGFYGFSVYDMIDVNDKVQAEEKLNGHWFDVHTVRELQLYPLQPGLFTIDAMELANEVEFSRSVVNKKTEQEVTENMYGNGIDSSANPAAGTYRMNIKSSPVVIRVIPLPGKNLADTFTGCVGAFSIAAAPGKDSLLKNQEGNLTVTIRGEGNFQRVNAPPIAWPKGIEYFEPTVRDTFDKQQVPLKGQREFSYIFVSDKPGIYTMPPISFTFFTLQNHSYKTVSTKPFTLFISAKSKRDKPVEVSSNPFAVPRHYPWKWMFATVPVLLALVFFWMRSRGSKIAHEKQQNLEPAPAVTVQEILAPAREVLNGSDKVFYELLDVGIWHYINDRFATSGAHMVKQEITGLLISKGVDPEQVKKLLAIVHRCETGIYTNAEMGISKIELLDEAEKALLAMDSSLA